MAHHDDVALISRVPVNTYHTPINVRHCPDPAVAGEVRAFYSREVGDNIVTIWQHRQRNAKNT